jgi:transcriptional regulator with XRE-family HTH domain
MKEKKADIFQNASAFSKAFREFILGADSKDLEEAIASEGEDPKELAARGRAITLQALKRHEIWVRAEEQARTEAEALHEGLSALLQLLRRKEGMSEEDLAKKARVDVEEIRCLECDMSYTPSPRTIYQLEQVFKLPSRTLVLLSGAKKRTSPGLTNEVMRFAANAKTMGKLNSAEMNLLNEFVNFLSSQEGDKENE